MTFLSLRRLPLSLLALALTLTLLIPAPASALVTAFRQAIAEGVAAEDGLAEFYRGRAFEPIWT
ncbi:MAG: L,D-transpeptidase family protein, partial [Alterinioella nitratireducens]